MATKRPAFSVVKGHYRTQGTHSCSMSFPNTCAIRMSEALVAAEPTLLGVFKASEKRMKINLCPHGYVRGAQDLAAILAKYFGPRDLGWEAPASAPQQIQDKAGIICFMNIPTFPDGQGHIDLWDRSGPIGSAYWTASPIWMWKLT